MIKAIKEKTSRNNKTELRTSILSFFNASNLHAQALKFRQNENPQAPHKMPKYF